MPLPAASWRCCHRQHQYDGTDTAFGRRPAALLRVRSEISARYFRCCNDAGQRNPCGLGIGPMSNCDTHITLLDRSSSAGSVCA